MKTYKLPNEEITKSLKRYLSEWKKLGKDVCSLYKEKASLIGFDPDLLISIQSENKSWTEHISVDLAKRISELKK